jgi:hypothetical protein
MTGGGTNLVREAVWSRRNRLTSLARDAGVSSELLDAFAKNHADLPVDAIQYIVSDIWGGTIIFDSAADSLTYAPAAPARSLGTPPQLTMKLPVYSPGPISQRGR